MNTAFIRQVGVARWAARYSWLLFRRKVLGVDSWMTLPTGAVMLLPRHSQSSGEVWVTNANIDWGSERLFARFADRNRDFLDIGAHVGYYAAYLSPLVRKTYAFEPDGRNIPALRENASLSRNVEVVQCAVSSKTGSAPLFVGQGSAVSSLEILSEGTKTVEVVVTTVDAFAASHSELDVGLIKTDVEGHDLEALRGMQATVARCQPLILTECAYTSDLAQLCASWGYMFHAFTRDRQTMQIRLRRLAPTDLETLWYKMLFLVPLRLQQVFNDLVR
jgi:FkbM family methyltransferase